MNKDDLQRRAKAQPGEHPIVSKLVLIRIDLNHEFGHTFAEWDHELAQVELELQRLLNPRGLT